MEALSDSQDLVQENEQSVQQQTANKTAQKDSEVQEAISTVKAILAKQGVAMSAQDSTPESIQQLLQQAQLVDESLKVNKAQKTSGTPSLKNKTIDQQHIDKSSNKNKNVAK